MADGKKKNVNKTYINDEFLCVCYLFLKVIKFLGVSNDLFFFFFNDIAIKNVKQIVSILSHKLFVKICRLLLVA